MNTTKYSHITMEERDIISVMKAEGHALRKIAKKLGRNPGTISREIRRNTPPINKGYYLPHRASERAAMRKSKAHQRPRLKNSQIRYYVYQKLQQGWSPEQISGRILRDSPSLKISHEAIYQYIYEQEPQWIGYLPRRHKKRWVKGHARRHRNLHIPNRLSINERPKHIEKRKQVGHWEADTIISSRKSKAALLILTERKTRFTKLKKLSQKTARLSRAAINRQFIHLPLSMRRTITYDNGCENTEHEKVNDVLGTRSYFCNPYHSYEKGTVENTIGLIRRLIPKYTDLNYIDHKNVKMVESLLNNRPRKCLNFETPFEVFSKYLQGVALKS